MKRVILCGGLALGMIGCGNNQDATGADGHQMNPADASRPDSTGTMPMNGGTNSGGSTNMNSSGTTTNNGGASGTTTGGDTASYNRMSNRTGRDSMR